MSKPDSKTESKLKKITEEKKEKTIDENAKIYFQIEKLKEFFKNQKDKLEKIAPLEQVYERDFYLRNADLFKTLNKTILQLHEELMMYMVGKHDEITHRKEKVVPLRQLQDINFTPFVTPAHSPVPSPRHRRPRTMSFEE